jgi:hypothetical protein
MPRGTREGRLRAGACLAFLADMRAHVHFSTVVLTLGLTPWLLGFSGAGVSAADGKAETPEPAAASREPASLWTTTIRIQFPASQLILWKPASDASVSLSGLSLSERFRGLFELEAGADYVANPCARGWQWSTRAGLGPQVLRPRPGGTRWDLRVPALASYHHTALSGDGCDGHVDKTVNVLTLDSGFDVTYWTDGRWGFNTRLLGGVGPSWEGRTGSTTQAGWALEGALAFGISF